MDKIGIGIDYSNICTGYNTSYLDRDNNDPDTVGCMKKVVSWTQEFLTEFLDTFEYKIFKLNSLDIVPLSEVASNRFLFYSLEKEITLQNYIMQKEYIDHESIKGWKDNANDGVIVRNDEDGEGIYIYLNKSSKEYEWITNKLNNFSLDDIPFDLK